MALRSLWNGTVTFGMVSVPIKLYSATETKTVHFHEVHAKDDSRIEHRKICSKEEKEVSKDEVVRGFEVDEDTYVVLEKDEIKAAAGDRGKFIHVEEFVDAGEIDPVFYEKTYYVGPRDDEDVFRLLSDALHKTGKAGIGRFTFHDREYLVALRSGDGAGGPLRLDTLRFHDEVVDPGDLEIPGTRKKPAPKEVKAAKKLVDMMAGDFKPGDWEDTYREAVLDLIKRKGKGEEIDLAAQEEPEQGDDLAAALEASLAGGR
jgi:DNA end-binding protein Ku